MLRDGLPAGPWGGGKNVLWSMKTWSGKTRRGDWPAHRAGLLWSNFFGQPGSVSKFPPFLWVKLCVEWVGRGYTEISRYFPALWINWVTLVTKKKLYIHWDFRSPLNHQKCLYGMLFLRLKAWFYVQYTIPPPAAMLGLLSLADYLC